MKFSEYFQSGHAKTYKRGDVVYRVGDQPRGLYLVEKGLVGLIIVGEKGNDHLVRLFKPEQLFGHRSFFAKESYHATATALEDTVLRFIPQEEVKPLMRSNCDFAESLLEVLAKEMRTAEMKQISLSEKDVTTRVAETLVYLKELHPQHAWTRQEIADYCGSTAATVIRTLAKFEEAGWIQQQGREIKILKKEKLLQTV